MNADYYHRLLPLAAKGLSAEEAEILLGHLDAALAPGARAGTSAGTSAGILRQVQAGTRGSAFNTLALHLSRIVRELAGGGPAARAPLVRELLHLRESLQAREAPATVAEADEGPAAAAPVSLEAAIARVYGITAGRAPADAEISIWKTNFANGLPFHEFLMLMSASPEAERHTSRGLLLPGASDGEFVQRAYELVLGRGAGAWEIDHWMQRIERGETTRAAMLSSLFETAVAFFDGRQDAVHDGLSALVMGTGRTISAAEWQSQARDMEGKPPPAADTRYAHRFHVRGEPRFLVSALASLYRGGDFIEQFMENICSQDGFDDYCELVIVDADSPENEYETIRRYLERHRNINYIRCNYRLGIYDAWNVAARAARGEYLTNTNMDDLRRHDSFMLQAGVLEELPFVDVVYQDLYYTFDPRLSFERIAAFGHETRLPVITPHNMTRFNSPHNAPMWRKRLHEDVGWFDTRYRSAGDHDFWMRCVAAGKTFYKINDPHVAYYQNPKGLSTRPDTRGVLEAMQIHKEFCRKVIPAEAVMPQAEFLRRLEPSVPPRPPRERYAAAQAALRQAARRLKFAAPAPESP